MQLRQIRKLMGYKGAGVAFIAPDKQGHLRVLLGQRLLWPFAGYWSLPAGGMEKWDEGDFRTCAAREAIEETIGLGACPAVSGLLQRRVSEGAEHRFCLPFFEFRSYCVRLKKIPNSSQWPVKWQSEFARFAWFPLDGLPRRSHPGLRAAIEFFKSAAPSLC
jgi:8-oxo-dGTP pyrophosphatase MutT (NUDIX family)